MESRESSSPIVTRAVAAALKGEFSDAYTFPAHERLALRLLGHLPQSVSTWLIPRVQSSGALEPEAVWNLPVDDLVRNRLRDYRELEGRFPAVTVGVAQGGATAHLSLALGGPFLPQAFVLTLKHGSLNGDVEAYYRRSAELARRIADRNPGVMTIQHYDPIHDGWLTRRVNHIRIKMLELPDGYKQFLREKLVPGGEVVSLEGQATWLRYRLAERSVFQVGGWGDLSAEEFLDGSQRIRTYCQREGLTYMDWHLNGFPLERGAESEWGSEPGLGEALEAFCAREGYQFTRITLPDPNDISTLAFRAQQRLLEKDGRPPTGVVVEMFSQFDATAVMQAGLLPLWLIFNTHDSRRFLEKMSQEFPRDVPLFFSPLATFSRTPDLAGWEDWRKALGGREWINIGAREGHYPADPLALIEWQQPLRAWVRENRYPIHERLSGEELKRLIQPTAILLEH